MRLIFTCLCFALLFTSCEQQQQTATAPAGTSSTGAAKNVRLAFVTNNAANFWTVARKGCEKADAELDNVTVEFKIPSTGDATEQKRVVDDLVAKGIDGMAISPVDPDNQTTLINDLAKQMTVITQDSDAPKSDRACYIGTDNVAAGRQAGELIKEALPAGGKIMVFVGKLDARNAQERLQGIKEALQGSKVEIIDVRTDDTDQVRAKSNVADTLVRYPDIGALVGLWSYNGPAILNAVRDANKTGQVKIICFDDDEATLAGVKEGGIYATVAQQPYEFGYQAIKLLDKIARGDKSAVPPSKQIFIPALVVNKEKIDDFMTKMKELQGR